MLLRLGPSDSLCRPAMTHAGADDNITSRAAHAAQFTSVSGESADRFMATEPRISSLWTQRWSLVMRIPIVCVAPPEPARWTLHRSLTLPLSNHRTGAGALGVWEWDVDPPTWSFADDGGRAGVVLCGKESQQRTMKSGLRRRSLRNRERPSTAQAVEIRIKRPTTRLGCTDRDNPGLGTGVRFRCFPAMTSGCGACK